MLHRVLSTDNILCLRKLDSKGTQSLWRGAGVEPIDGLTVQQKTSGGCFLLVLLGRRAPECRGGKPR